MRERILAIAEKVKTGWDLMSFMGSCEKEVMVAQTIQACKTNLERHGSAFSFCTLYPDSGTGLIKNGEACVELKQDGYFVESEFQGRATIIPTEKLLDRLEKYLQHS